MKHPAAHFFFAATIFCCVESIKAQQGEWTWMKGSDYQGASAVFGTQGVADPANTPPALYGAASWTDKQGRLWLFGGYTTTGESAATLWMYDISSNEWTWVKGPSTYAQYGVYGTKGVPDDANYPGSRAFGFPSWVDTSGNLWLYGGYGYGASQNGYLEDLWKYDVSTNQWTWMAGYNFPGLPPYYGIKGTAGPNNHPGARCETTCSWVDKQNRLWFFGGVDFNYAQKDDVWMYDVASGEWTWMGGGNGTGTPPSWGTQGVFSSGNTPGGRVAYCSWTDTSDHFWLYGGGKDVGSIYADLWEYNISLNEWAWISGDNAATNNGNHGTQCDNSVYFPKSRTENRASWTDSCSQLWLFGGAYDDYNGGDGLNDLWVYMPTLNQWAWVSGDSTFDSNASWGTQGISSPSNKPSSRSGAPSWLDKDGNLWFFGGSHITWSLPYNDLWRYVPDSACHACGIANVNPPVANFAASDSTICVNDCISFSDFSLNSPTSWEWQFTGGNPSSSTEQNPGSICYNAPGSFDVMLITSNSFGSDTTLLQDYITVNANPAPSISVTGNVFTASASSSYQWYVNGQLINGATSQTYTTTQSGNYSVVVTDANGCSGTTSYNFSSVAFSSTDTTLCEKFCIDFSDQSFNNPVSWQWTFEGGSPSTSTAQNPTNICYDDPGVYDVTLITVNSLGNSDTLTLTNYITVFQNPFAPTITQNGNVLTSSFGNTYQWFLNSNIIPGATNQSYTISQSGLYTVEITNEDGCKSQSTVQAYVGIDEINNDFFVNVFGNPSDGEIILEGTMPATDKIEIQLINALGQEVFETTKVLSSNFHTSIDVKNLAAGIYFVKLTSGSLQANRKIFISR